MTLREVIRSILALIEEYSQEDVFSSDDDDINKKLIPIINASQVDLCQEKPIIKVKKFTQNEKEDKDNHTVYSFGRKLYQIQSVKKLSGKGFLDYEEIGGRLYVKNSFSGDFEVIYSVYPTDFIQDGTKKELGEQLDYELELDRDAVNVLIYAVAGDILKTDVSLDYSMFEKKYTDLLNKLLRTKSSSIAKVKYIHEGMRI